MQLSLDARITQRPSLALSIQRFMGIMNVGQSAGHPTKRACNCGGNIVEFKPRLRLSSSVVYKCDNPACDFCVGMM
ncbi:MAG: hypothetical protein K8Q97_03765 [Candidatus Andersenbacteria bacterium]|nr:hypothetical protein [Candidatus Andersenbacteria bacterium]